MGNKKNIMEFPMKNKNCSLEEKIKKYPQIHQRFELLIDIIEDAEGELDKANAAEERVIQELQQMGKEALQHWANEKEIQKARQFREINKQDVIKNKGKKKIYWYTTYGEISICESRFTKNNILDRPFSYSADIQCRGYSVPLQRRMTDFGADDSFAKASAKMD